MFPYVIDDFLDEPLTSSVEVTISFPGGKRWLLFATPHLLATVGDLMPDSDARVHLGERHMIVVSRIDRAIIHSVLSDLAAGGELESRTLPSLSEV